MPGLSFGLVDGRPVFMDEREDSYFLLEPEQEAQFFELLSPLTHRRQPSAALRRSLGLPGECQTLCPALPPAAESSILDEHRPLRRTRLTDVVIVWRTLNRVRRSIRRRPIQSLLDDLRASGQPGNAAPPPDQVTGLALVFSAARRAVPIAPNCLSDSLALLAWLGSARSAATLVFGVKLDPFAAHCWVQAGSILLNDRVDAIARFQPVRTVSCSPATR